MQSPQQPSYRHDELQRKEKNREQTKFAVVNMKSQKGEDSTLF